MSIDGASKSAYYIFQLVEPSFHTRLQLVKTPIDSFKALIYSIKTSIYLFEPPIYVLEAVFHARKAVFHGNHHIGKRRLRGHIYDSIRHAFSMANPGPHRP